MNVQDAGEYVEHIREKFGKFQYYSNRIHFEPEKRDEYQKFMVGKASNPDSNPIPLHGFNAQKRKIRSKSLHAPQQKEHAIYPILMNLPI